jgi:penicillin-binding protein 1B
LSPSYDKDWEERNLVRLNELPPYLVDTILSSLRFYQHFGVDIRSIAGAIWVDLKNRAIVQGGSTVTQQLVKNFYLNQGRTLFRNSTSSSWRCCLSCVIPGKILEAA